MLSKNFFFLIGHLPIMVQYSKSKYMVWFSISKNPIYSIFVEIKQSLIMDPDLDQLDNWAHN